MARERGVLQPEEIEKLRHLLKESEQ
jgi:hypothetical protein